MSNEEALNALKKVLLEWMDAVLPPERLDASLEVAGRYVDRVRHAHYAGVNMFGGLMDSLPDFANHPVFLRHRALAIHHREGAALSVRSVILAVHGAYNAAYSLLRSLLEIILRGVAVDYAATHMQSLPGTLTKEFVRTSGLADVLEEGRVRRLGDRFEHDSFKFLVFLGKSGVLFAPSFDALCKQLGVWGMLRPIEDLRSYVDYRELSLNVHGQYRRSDTARASAAGRPITGKPAVVEAALVHYTESYGRVADVCGVVVLNLLREEIAGNPSMREYIKLVRDSLQLRAARLPNTTGLVRELAT